MTNKINTPKKEDNMQTTDRSTWDNLLESESGMAAFKSLMDQAKKEDAEGTSEES